ncbi:MAG: Ig-like domain-containing protein [Acidobacteriota bacterium]
MHQRSFTPLRLMILILLVRLITPGIIYQWVKIDASVKASIPLLLQNSGLKLQQRNPVVNEGGQITLTALDANDRPVTGVVFVSGSPDIAVVDQTTGLVRGVKRGFATITARRGNDSVSTFVVVTRVEKGNGVRVPGDTKTDMSGRVFLSDPVGNVIMVKNGLTGAAEIFAGRKGAQGRRDDRRLEALFAGPTAVAVDNNVRGGIYIADTLNHSIRKVSFDDRVTTILGSGDPGITRNDITLFGQVKFNGPRGVAVDVGGNLIIADTDNHAIYIADFAKQEVRLLAGSPGLSGKMDGKGREALFTRPTSIAVNADGRSIAVVDAGNKRIRLITRDGRVTTLGASSIRTTAFPALWETEQNIGEFIFEDLQSVSFDSTDNIYIVDKNAVQVATRPLNSAPQLIPLAQPVVSFAQPVSVTVKGTQVFVLDASVSNDSEAVKVVSVGEPQINNMQELPVSIQPNAPLAGGSQIILNGANFAPESKVIVGDSEIANLNVESATRIRFILPPQKAPGRRTISVQTRGGVAQVGLLVTSKPFSQLANGEITTAAGGIPFLGDGGDAKQASLNLDLGRTISPFLSFGQNISPFSGVTGDSTGKLFIADSRNNRIRRVDLNTGVITTVAGNGIGGFDGDGDLAISASLNKPTAVAIDNAGNLFIADTGNNRIRRVDILTGIITTIAGSDVLGFTGDGGLAINATFRNPISIAVDANGNLFIADRDNHSIRRIDALTTIITTVAGVGARRGFAGDGGLATAALLAEPRSIALDNAGNLFISDGGNNRIRRVDATTKVIATVAGNGGTGTGGDGGPAVGASFSAPEGIAIDVFGNLFIADSLNNRIRRVDGSSKIISTFAGNGAANFSGDGGLANIASINFPTSVFIDGTVNLFIADTRSNRVRQVNVMTGVINTAAGGAALSIGDGGAATAASLATPTMVVKDRAENMIIADAENNLVRRVDSTGTITTLAGNGQAGFSGDGRLAIEASLNQPTSMAMDEKGNIFIADTLNQRIRRIDAASQIITTVAGNGRQGFGGDNGPAINASLNSPSSVAVDKVGNLFIADRLNDRIRRVDAATSIITTVVGSGARGFGGDNGLAINASLNSPTSVVVDQTGNLFIADLLNQRIRKVDATTKLITTVAGNGTKGFNGERILATNANLSNPSAVVVDSSGNLFIADTSNERIRRVDARSGLIVTVAGNGARDYRGDGGPAVGASLNMSQGLTIDDKNSIIIADSNNNSVRIMKDAGVSGPGGFELSVNPVTQNVSPGASTSFSIAVQGFGGFAELVSLAATVTPANALVTNFTPTAISPGSSATLTVSVPQNTPASVFSITITGIVNQTVDTKTVTVQVRDEPPRIALIPDQTVKIGQVSTVTVTANDPNGNNGLKLSLAARPEYVSLVDTGNGVGTIRIAPTVLAQNGIVIVQATDAGGKFVQASFNIIVQPPDPPVIENALFTKPELVIKGRGFGTTGATVNVNGINISSFITKQEDTMITLRGNKKKLGIKRGQNQVTVSIAGVVSNTVVFNFFDSSWED